MKKLLVIAILVSLALGSVGGFAYANDHPHQVMEGDKLVGFGPFGTLSQPDGTNTSYITNHIFNNPDCAGTIKLERLSIINSRDGILVYEGPVIQNQWDPDQESMNTTIITELGPHEFLAMGMARYMAEESNPHDPEWLSPEEALSRLSAPYTVEIMWSAKRSNCPLVGHTNTTITQFDPKGHLKTRTQTGVQMWNLKQRLTEGDD